MEMASAVRACVPPSSVNTLNLERRERAQPFSNQVSSAQLRPQLTLEPCEFLLRLLLRRPLVRPLRFELTLLELLTRLLERPITSLPLELRFDVRLDRRQSALDSASVRAHAVPAPCGGPASEPTQ
jgi:hypothetical protein